MTSSRSWRFLRSIAVVATAVIAMTALSQYAAAQSDSPPPAWDLFAGYQYLAPGETVPTYNSDPSNPTAESLAAMNKGFGTALTYNFDKSWGGELDYGFDHNSPYGSHDWTLSAGPRFMWRTDTANAFIHALIGMNRLGYDFGTVKNLGIGVLLGGGMDLPLTKKISWRMFQVDYTYGHHNFADLAGPTFGGLRRPSMEGVRLRTGILINWAGAAPLTPAGSCSVQPTEVMVGEPITATVTPSNFNPKHTVTYSWSGTGGQVTGKDTSATIDTNNVAPGNYAVTAHVTDPKLKTANEATCSASYTIKPLPPKNPPTMSVSSNPAELVPGGTANLSANCSSPDSVPVSVANWTSTTGTVSGSGNSAILNTAGLTPGPVTVSATCTDNRGLSTQASTQVTIQNPPPPPVDKALEARLALHSVYFPTALPSVKEPSGGLLPGQQKVLMNLATDFKKYLEAKPDAHLTLEGHADHRGPVAFNQALSERRVARVKSFLVEQGVPEADIETKAFGAGRNLTTDEVKQSIQQNTELTTEERNRALRQIIVIRMASNRRVDVTLNAAGQTETSVRQFPFNAADALSLIGGRESERKPAAKTAPKKKVTKKP